MMPHDRERALDALLLERIAAGDEPAFAQLYDRFAPGLFSLALKIMGSEAEAQDAVQDTFMHIWRKAATYNRGRSRAFSWAVMVLRNKAIDRVRMRLRVGRIIERATAEFSHREELAESAAVEASLREERARVRAALAEIGPEQKEAVELAFFSDLSHEEIAEQLCEPLGTIKGRIRRGLVRLHRLLKGVA